MITQSSERITALVADDEPLVRRGLARLLGDCADVTIVGESRDGIETIEAVRRLKPDLLFLDVQMPGLDGITVLRMLDVDRPRAVVFVTAFDQYALAAFDHHAVDYLLKPFDDRRFATALERVRERLRGPVAVDHRITRLLEALASGRPKWLERIPSRVGARVVLVPVEDVIWFEAADNYVRLRTATGKHVIRETLRNLERQLDPTRFARIHRSAIVNLAAVKELVAQPSGDYLIALTDGGTITLSRSYRAGLEKALGRSL